MVKVFCTFVTRYNLKNDRSDTWRKGGYVNKYFLFLLTLLVFLFVRSSGLYAQAKNGANDNQINKITSVGEGPTVWAAPAEQKVRPDDVIETDNLVWSQRKKTVSVAGAGNEHVPFQVVITNPVPSGYRPKAPDGFFIKSSDFTSQHGKVIPRTQVSFYLEHYIMIYAESSPVGATGYWPDALAPIKVPFSMAAQYSVVKNRPIWVDISVPSSTPAGTYTGNISVTKDGKEIEGLTVELEVYNFSLPEKRNLITYMNVSKGSLASFYHKEASSPEIDKLTQKYYDFLYSHRMEPWFNDQLLPKINVKNGEVDVEFNDARYEYYLNKLNSRRVLLNAFPSQLKKQLTAKEFSKEFDRQVKSYLSKVKMYFQKHGWVDRLVFNSPIDEPNTKQDYEDTRYWAHLVHDAAPGVPFLATESPVTDNPEWGTLQGAVNDFSIHGNALNKLDVQQAIVEEEKKGGEMTWYISCDQVYPQPNYFIDAPALDPVMVPWITYRYQMKGILYWAMNFWSETPDPWLDPVTFISGFLCSGGYVLNGEGSLLYPGDHTKKYTGQPDVDGPVSSIRMELLRDGIEDYEYLNMLKDLGDKQFADSLVRNMVVGVRAFSRNKEDLYFTRKAMAKRLEQLSKK
ncbi:MAG: glycoside hydrolase domain-containing protein [Ginsengibacter sp.]